MGRPRKYHTEEQRKMAERDRSRRRRAAAKLLRDAEHDLMNIQLDVLPSTHTQVPHDIRDDAYRSVFAPSVDLYHNNQNTERNKNINAKKQIGQALKCISGLLKKPRKGHRGSRRTSSPRMFSFKWDNMDDDEQEYMFNRLGDILKRWSEVIGADSKWLLRYKFDDHAVVTKPMNSDTVAHLISKLKREGFINSVTDEMAIYEASDYDYFPLGIKMLTRLEFIDGSIEVKPKRKKREGGFWKWILNVPIDLSEYQIFNRINKNTIEQMTRDNCVIYACIKSGINDDVIRHMRQVFKNRFISITKLDTVGKECNILFNVLEAPDIEE